MENKSVYQIRLKGDNVWADLQCKEDNVWADLQCKEDNVWADLQGKDEEFRTIGAFTITFF